MKNRSLFCTCTDHSCPCHPTNHENGCSPCIAKCLAQREIPSCFFNMVGSVKDHTTYFFEDFARAVLRSPEDPPGKE